MLENQNKTKNPTADGISKSLLFCCDQLRARRDEGCGRVRSARKIFQSAYDPEISISIHLTVKIVSLHNLTSEKHRQNDKRIDLAFGSTLTDNESLVEKNCGEGGAGRGG